MTTSPQNVRDVTVIGSGPAGLTAAIYTSRASLQPLVIEGEPSSTTDQPGGQLMLTTEVENFPGFPEGAMGPELMANFRKQAERFGAEIITKKVSKVDLSAHPFKVWISGRTDGDPDFLTKTVIVSTGAQSLMLGLDREVELIGHGVSTCATCDGFFFRDQEIAVVGGGDSALEEAMFLTRFASKVHLMVRRDELRASKIMQERALANDKIQVHWNSSVIEYVGADKLESVKVRNNVDDSVSDLAVTGLFIAIGHKPNTSLFEGQLDMHDDGYLKTVRGRTATNIDGVFAAGDVQDSYYRQAITAAGSGCQAALEAERWLEANE